MALQNSYFWRKTCQKSSNFTEGWTVTRCFTRILLFIGLAFYSNTRI